MVLLGKGTSKPLIQKGIIPEFEPSEATGEVLAKELPLSLGSPSLCHKDSI